LSFVWCLLEGFQTEAGVWLVVYLGHDQVQGKGTAAQELAGVAMAEDVFGILKLDGPFSLAAVAFCGVGRHCELFWRGEIFWND
jgi:hypothetical protein